jgi:hypothetical protein
MNDSEVGMSSLSLAGGNIERAVGDGVISPSRNNRAAPWCPGDGHDNYRACCTTGDFEGQCAVHDAGQG